MTTISGANGHHLNGPSRKHLVMLHTKDKCCPLTDPHAQNLSDFGRGPLADYIIILHIKALGVAILDIKIVSNCIFN